MPKHCTVNFVSVPTCDAFNKIHHKAQKYVNLRQGWSFWIIMRRLYFRHWSHCWLAHHSCSKVLSKPSTEQAAREEKYGRPFMQTNLAISSHLASPGFKLPPKYSQLLLSPRRSLSKNVTKIHIIFHEKILETNQHTEKKTNKPRQKHNMVNGE